MNAKLESHIESIEEKKVTTPFTLRRTLTGRIVLSLVALLTAGVLILGITTQGTWAKNDEEEVVEFEEAEIFFEFNATDLDLGIQIFFDATGWKEVEVIGPDGSIFEVENGKGLKQIGSTEVFTESAEPQLDEENFEEEFAAFLAMFPEGEYEFEGETIDGEKMEGTAELTWDLPFMVDLDVEGFPTIEWTPSAEGPQIVRYEVVVEMVVDDSGEEQVYQHSVEFPASVTEMTASEAFTDLADDFELSGDLLELKVELIAEEASGNKTITEIPVFELEE